MSLLIRIKRLVLAGDVVFTEKADVEVEADGLTHELVLESILNAPEIHKILRSIAPGSRGREFLYVIRGLTFDGMRVYTKGRIATRNGREVLYVLVSSKRDQAS